MLRNAFDEAWALLPDDRKSERQQSDMAQRILKKAAEGVRDPVRLRAYALPCRTGRWTDHSFSLGGGSVLQSEDIPYLALGFEWMAPHNSKVELQDDKTKASRGAP